MIMAEQIHENKGEAFTGIRLPNQFVPKHYDLRLKPDLKNFTFEGTVKVDFVKPQHGARITLHALELDITEGHANGEQSDKESVLKRVIYNKDNETATLVFDDQVGLVGSIFLKFRGVLNDKLKGFYRTSFRLENQTIYAAVTQFEATDARRCFPCWDEPSFKATFSATLVFLNQPSIPGTNYNLVPLSNMPIISQIQGDGEDELAVTFETTPIMSTYLLAFALGPFDYIEKSESKRTLRVYTVPGKKEQGRFALEVASKAINFYEQYFDIPYPLPKMDLIALPDFASMAMENWGLVTYREIALLVDPNNTTSITRQRISNVVCHEVSHQWFGNLVTMEWWTHLWLNEGFARFMEYLCVDHIFPEFDIWSQFVSVTYLQALELDSLHSSHPIEVPVKSSSEIDEIFDIISYSKGACIIRMLYHYIGGESFKSGLKDYLTKFAYKNTVTEDLWDALGAASKKPVREMMSGWTSRTGYPWLSVTLSNEGDGSKLVLTQSKFTADGKLSEEEKNLLWMFPVSYTTSKKSYGERFISGKSSFIVLGLDEGGWVKFNPGNVSLYRTVYPADLLIAFPKAIMEKTLPAIDRLGIQNDYFAMSQAGKVSTVDLLKLLEAYKDETDYNVWSSINSCLGKLNILFSNTDYQDKFKLFGAKLYSKIFGLLSWTPKAGESHTDAMLRALIINGLVSFGDQAVISEAKRKFQAHVDGSSTVPADLRGAVYKAVSIHGDDRSFDQLFEMYRSSELHEEKLHVLTALASTKQGPRLDRVVGLILSDEVRNQDKVFGLLPIGIANPSVAWNILKENRVRFEKMLGTGRMFGRTVKFCTENFANEQMATEIQKFFEKNKYPGLERTIQQSLENIRISAAWLKRDSDVVKVFLSNQ